MRAEDAEVIARWVGSREELRFWAGSTAGWPVQASHLHDWHTDPDVHPYVLLWGGSPVGYGEIWLDYQEREVELARLIVRPDLRGRGIGRHLIRSLMETAASTGLPIAFLRVMPENVPALACYESSGFVRLPVTEQERYNHGQTVEYVWLSSPLAGGGTDRAPGAEAST